MDSKDRPEPNVPAVPLRISSARPAVLDTMTFGKSAVAEPARSVNIFRATLRALSRHWWQILLLWGLATGGLCFLIIKKVKPMYAADAVLRVEPSHRDILNTGMYSQENIATFMETQVQLIKSANVLSQSLTDPLVVSQPSLNQSKVNDPEGELRRLLEVSQVTGSYLLQVQWTSESPQESAMIVNSVVNSYLKSSADWTDSSTKGQIKNLEGQLQELINATSAKEDELLALVKKGNLDLQFEGEKADGAKGDALPTRSILTNEEFKQIKSELLNVDLELASAEALLAGRESNTGGGDKVDLERRERLLDQRFRALPEIVNMLEKRDQYFQDYLNKSGRVRNPANDPSVQAVVKKIEALDKRFDKRYEELRDDLLAQLEAGGGDEAGKALREARDKVEGLRAKKKSLEAKKANSSLAQGTESTDAMKALMVREELQGLNSMKDQIRKLLTQLRFVQKSDARVSLVNFARPNTIPVSDNRKKFLIGTPFAVLFFVLGLFVVMEVKIGRVSDLEDLSKLMPVEVFALPPLPGPRLEPGQRGAREREARLQEFLQSLDHLRVAICDEHVAGTGAGGRCITITSATASEGKTTLSAQLSACCAKAGISTLLIDADMRRATLSRMLNEEKSPGLSDLLQGDMTPEEAAISIPDAGFHLVPAGSPGRDPSWLLKGQRIGQVLTRYRQLFDLIIIDTPPVLPVPDALTIGRWSDGAVLTTRFDVSRFPMVERARRRLSSAGITLLTTVVNGVRTSRFYNGYNGYGYGYGYGYGGYGGYAQGDRAVTPPESPTPTSTSA